MKTPMFRPVVFSIVAAALLILGLAGLAVSQQPAPGQPSQQGLKAFFKEVPKDQQPAGNGSVIGAVPSSNVRSFFSSLGQGGQGGQPGQAQQDAPVKGLFSAIMEEAAAQQQQGEPAAQPQPGQPAPTQPQPAPSAQPMTPEEEIQTAIAEAKEFAEITYDFLAIDKVNKRLEARGIRMVPVVAPGQAITIDEIVINGLDLEADNFETGDVNVKNVRIPVTPEIMEEAYGFLSQMGYTEMVLNFTMASVYDPAARSFTLKHATLSAQDAGSLGFSLELLNVEPNEMAGSMQPGQAALRRAELVYTDHSFTERGLKMAAAMQNIGVEEFRQQGITELDNEITKARQEGSLKMAAAMEQVQAFLKKPGTLRVTLAPSDAVGFESLMQAAGPGPAMDLLQVSVTAE